MSNLKIINKTNEFKMDDTGSNIQFKAFDDNNSPVSLKQGQTATFTVMNGLGKLLDIQAVTSQGGYVFNLPTNKLSMLRTGRYQVELKVNGVIYPDKDFVPFVINDNLVETGITNTQTPNAPTIDTSKIESTLETSLKSYADNEITTQINELKATIHNGKDGLDGTNGLDGKNATMEIGTVSALPYGSQPTVTNSGTETDAILNFGIPQGKQGIQGPQGKNGADGKSATVEVGNVATIPYGHDAVVMNSGSDTNAILNFEIPEGKNGTDGKNGEAATIKVGQVTTLNSNENATVTNVGTDTNAVLNFGIPKGEKGETTTTTGTVVNGKDGKDGKNATIQIGKVTELSSDSKPTVSNSGTETNAVLNFGIPQGKQGIQGPQGQQGPQGLTGKNATITVGKVTDSDKITTPQITNSGTALNAIFDFVFPKLKQATSSSPSSNTSTNTSSSSSTLTAQDIVKILQPTPLTKQGADLNYYKDNGLYICNAMNISLQNNAPGCYASDELVLINKFTTVSEATVIVQYVLDLSYNKIFVRFNSGWMWSSWLTIVADMIDDTPIACPNWTFNHDDNANFYTEYMGNMFCYHPRFSFTANGNLSAGTVPIFQASFKPMDDLVNFYGTNTTTGEICGVSYNDGSSVFQVNLPNGIQKGQKIAINGSALKHG